MTRLAAACDKVYQLLAHGRWFSLGTPASATTTTGRHDIAEIFLKVTFSTKNQSINHDLLVFQYIEINIIHIKIIRKWMLLRIKKKRAINFGFPAAKEF